MRKFFALVLFFGAFSASAQVETDSTQWVTGRGRYSAFCTGSDYFCYENIKRHARRYAEDDGAWQCRSRDGEPQMWGASCHEFCHPFSIPHDSQGFVSCDSECSVRCDFPDHNRAEVQ